MKSMTQKITSPEFNDVFVEKLTDYRRSGGIFLSYNSKDIVIAKKIFYQLHDRYNVWFDNSSLRGGDNYDHKIEEAIAAARIFIPILTPHIAKRSGQMGISTITIIERNYGG